ncbi:unnamed protein product [Cuscuta campestris]|uniref:CCHC-type domain-containing protein n=1 Tax=Cuscuta campestris TaxID=132261 RepID=A0A484LIF2_9ASTE|nr:unnamed protein product [Cuscuta campestris]
MDEKEYVLEKPIPPAPPANAPKAVKDAYEKHIKDDNQVSCVMLATMITELQKQHEDMKAHEMIVALWQLYQGQSRHERFLKELAMDLIVQSLPEMYKGFVMNYMMHDLDKPLPELLKMLQTAEENLTKGKSASVLMVQGGKGKPKKGIKIKARTVIKPKSKSTSSATQKPVGGVAKGKCHHCGKAGHWRRNCKTYLATKKKEGTTISSEGLKQSRRLARGEIELRVGNGAPVAALAIGTYSLVLPSGLMFELNDCLYVPEISRNIISVSCLDKSGFIISNANMTNGLYVLDLDMPVYNISAKRNKPNGLNQTYLWHCRLGHINEKRISKLHRSGILESFDLESYDTCESCLLGKMTKSPFTGHNERAGDLLALIHSDVCGPFNTTARESFWGYALSTAIYTLNRVPTKAVERTPYQLWTGKCPVLSHLKIWGCEAYVKRLMMNGKLDAKSDKCFFVGYPKETRETYLEAISCPEDKEWRQAMQSEMDSMYTNKIGLGLCWGLFSGDSTVAGRWWLRPAMDPNVNLNDNHSEGDSVSPQQLNANQNQNAPHQEAPHGGLVGIPQMDPALLMQLMQQMLIMNQNALARQHEPRITLERLRKNGAEEFLGENIADPLVAFRWLERVRRVFENLKVPVGEWADLAGMLLQNNTFVKGMRMNLQEGMSTASRQDFGVMYEQAKEVVRTREGAKLVVEQKANKMPVQVASAGKAYSGKRPLSGSGIQSSKKAKSRPAHSVSSSSKTRPSKHPMCESCGRNHPGECWRSLGLCMGCGHQRSTAGSQPQRPPQQRQPQATPHQQGRAPARTYAMQGRADPNHDVILGMFTLFGSDLLALIDPGSTLSYICVPLPANSVVARGQLESPMLVSNPLGHSMSLHHVYRQCPLTARGKIFLADLIELPYKEFDIILGMDWLTEHQAVVDCSSRTVRLRAPDGDTIMIDGELFPKAPEFISYMQAKRLVRKKCEAFLCTVKDVRKEPPSLKDIPSVRDFPDVFPDELPDPTHRLPEGAVTLDENLTYEEAPMQILAREVKELRNKRVPLVKVLWRNHAVEEATWETEESMRVQYPHLFCDDG